MPQDRMLIIALWVAVAVGALVRLHVLPLGEDALARTFMTEDGYLMLTVARNLALGLGLSVSEGTIATNGVQPLATFLYAIPFVPFDGNKVAGVAGATLLGAAFSVAAFLAIRAFAKLLLADEAPSPWPLAVATLWFLGPLALFHGMNGLETGLYVALAAGTAVLFGRLCAGAAPYAPRDQVLLGVACGLLFLARIDGAFLVAALFAVRFVQVQATGRLTFAGAVREAVPPGLIALAFAAPWLIHNQILFGSIIPISGTAQSATASLGGNAPLVAAKLFETMFPPLPIPNALETVPAVQWIAGVAVAGVLGAFLWRCLRQGGPVAAVATAYTLYGAALVVYYGFFFGAPHFLSRYFAPLAPLLVTAAVWAGLQLAERIRTRRAAPAAALAAIALCAALTLRQIVPGVNDQGHFQVVDWVRANVSDETWVGAVQTGTLGYWHDRTVNLDGKVNPAALRARLEDGHVLRYVVEGPIDVLADWVGIAGWAALEAADFNRHFELLVEDHDRNLAVLVRRAGGTEQGG